MIGHNPQHLFSKNWQTKSEKKNFEKHLVFFFFLHNYLTFKEKIISVEKHIITIQKNFSRELNWFQSKYLNNNKYSYKGCYSIALLARK